MLTLIFKNVDQGDTIVLEWENEKGDKEVGIVDCNTMGTKANMAVEHIIANGYKEIAFMIMTHPHTDHFSGFLSLLEYCEAKGIKIRSFWHTAEYCKDFLEEFLIHKITTKDFFESFVNRDEDISKIKKLFRKIDDLHKTPDSILTEANVANSTSKIKLNKQLWLEFLSPSTYDEIKQYFKNTFELDSEEKIKTKKRENNPEANLFSSFIRICSDNWQILLPSDSTMGTIERIMKRYSDISNINIIISQIPHHGSFLNHYDSFWNNLKNKENSPAFISVGTRYGHPSEEVVEFFDKNYKEIHSTNYVGGYKDYFESKKYKDKRIHKINNELDMHEEVIFKDFKKSFENCGEKKIKIEEDGSFTVFTIPEYC